MKIIGDTTIAAYKWLIKNRIVSSILRSWKAGRFAFICCAVMVFFVFLHSPLGYWHIQITNMQFNFVAGKYLCKHSRDAKNSKYRIYEADDKWSMIEFIIRLELYNIHTVSLLRLDLASTSSSQSHCFCDSWLSLPDNALTVPPCSSTLLTL